MVSSTALLSRESTATTGGDALIVAWQDPQSRRYHAGWRPSVPVNGGGLLDHVG
jgi:hypothetical protein